MPSDTMDSRQLYTFGYGNRAELQPLIDRCRTHGIDAVIDVRRNPRGWSHIWGKPYLSTALPHHGIDYLALDALGNISGTPDWVPPNRDHAETALRHLAEMCRTKTLVLMCAELDAGQCHRRQVAEELSQLTGLSVIDLR